MASKIALCQNTIHGPPQAMPATGNATLTAGLDLSSLTAAQLADSTISIRLAIEVQSRLIQSITNGVVRSVGTWMEWAETTWIGGTPAPSLVVASHGAIARWVVSPSVPLCLRGELVIVPSP